MGLPEPQILDVSVDGTQNAPGSEADGEVALDIQVAGGIYSAATGQQAKIRIYWCQDVAQGVLRAAQDLGELVIFAAAGDNDSSDGGSSPANVDCPASCPSIVACGGTMKPKSGPEVVWN